MKMSFRYQAGALALATCLFLIGGAIAPSAYAQSGRKDPIDIKKSFRIEQTASSQAKAKTDVPEGVLWKYLDVQLVFQPSKDGKSGNNILIGKAANGAEFRANIKPDGTFAPAELSNALPSEATGKMTHISWALGEWIQDKVDKKNSDQVRDEFRQSVGEELAIIERKKKAADKRQEGQRNLLDGDAIQETFNAENIRCCGSDDIQTVLDEIGGDAADYCKGESTNLSNLGFEKTDGKRDANHKLGCEDGTRFCVGALKCIYKFNGAALPFNGTAVCAVKGPKDDPSCGAKYSTACAQENLSVRNDKVGLSETIGEGTRFTPKDFLTPAGEGK